MLAIEAEGLVKSFGETRAVDGLDLVVTSESVHAVLGPNGAGKSTTIRILATLIQPDAGVARVFGHDILAESDSVRSRVSLTGQFASLDEDLTGWENLIILSRLLGYSRSRARERAAEMLEGFELDGSAGRQVRKYSGGMRRRLDIAASLLVTPDLLFLDEPTTGLDPRSRNQVWEMIRSVVGAGTTVLLTTQNLDEADQLADRITVIDHGRAIAEGTSGELKASVGSGVLRIRLLDPRQRPEVGQILSKHVEHDSVHLEADPASISARISDSDVATRALSDISRLGVGVADFAMAQPSLDEVFLALTGSTATAGTPRTGEAA